MSAIHDLSSRQADTAPVQAGKHDTGNENDFRQLLFSHFSLTEERRQIRSVRREPVVIDEVPARFDLFRGALRLQSARGRILLPQTGEDRARANPEQLLEARIIENLRARDESRPRIPAAQREREERARRMLERRFGGATAETFGEMLAWIDKPDQRAEYTSLVDNLASQQNDWAATMVSLTYAARMQVDSIMLQLERFGLRASPTGELVELAPHLGLQGTSMRLDLTVNVTQVHQARDVDLGDNLVLAASSGMFSVSTLLMLCDPLVLDLAGDGIDLRGVDDGIEFDITGDGREEETGFVQNDDALLYLDLNGNGLCDNGLELFGDQHGAANGFEELRRYDENGDAMIDERDAVFDQLRLFADRDGDGKNGKEESLDLQQARITGIALGYDRVHEADRHGNVISEDSQFLRADGLMGRIVDARFRYREA